METLKNRRAQKAAMEKKEYENNLIKHTIIKKNELQAILADKTQKFSIIEANIKKLKKQKATKQSDKIKNADTLITLKRIAKALRADVLKAEGDLKSLNSRR
jgi:hypothetical protein